MKPGQKSENIYFFIFYFLDVECVFILRLENDKLLVIIAPRFVHENSIFHFLVSLIFFPFVIKVHRTHVCKKIQSQV